MTNPPQRVTSVQGVMKQTSKTEAERGNVSSPDVSPQPTSENEEREGDKPIDRSKTGGSSPYEEPNHLAKKQRSE